MRTKGTNLFAQIAAFFDRHDFRKLVDKYGNDKHSKGFSSWEHFVSMLFCQLGKAQSLREICGGLASCTGKVVHLRMKEAPKIIRGFAKNFLVIPEFCTLFASVSPPAIDPATAGAGQKLQGDCSRLTTQ